MNPVQRPMGTSPMSGASPEARQQQIQQMLQAQQGLSAPLGAPPAPLGAAPQPAPAPAPPQGLAGLGTAIGNVGGPNSASMNFGAQGSNLGAAPSAPPAGSAPAAPAQNPFAAPAAPSANKGFKKGGGVKSKFTRGDGIAQKGRTKGKMR